jgi:alkylation response protein AidB-like acyl-CoA dehydrogenase
MMNGARIAVAAQAVGIAEAAYREAYAYARKRVQFGRSVDDFPAVYRMLLSMRSQIESTRALIYEAGRWVDLKKGYEHLKSQRALTAEERKRLKQSDRLAAILTPLAKYHATEMGNRVCYQAMQVHGGTGYMREFNVERHFRDIRVTSIYEGTSQLQVVAATSGLLGHSLDGLLDDFGDQDYGEDLAGLASQVAEATALLNRSIDHLKEQDDRALVDYYASDLADMAVDVLTSWLVLRDALTAERKRELARVYIAEMMPRFRGKMATIQAVDPAPLQAREAILAEAY